MSENIGLKKKEKKKELPNMLQGGQKAMMILFLFLYSSICSVDKIMLMNLKFEVLSSPTVHKNLWEA